MKDSNFLVISMSFGLFWVRLAVKDALRVAIATPLVSSAVLSQALLLCASAELQVPLQTGPNYWSLSVSESDLKRNLPYRYGRSSGSCPGRAGDLHYITQYVWTREREEGKCSKARGNGGAWEEVVWALKFRVSFSRRNGSFFEE